MDKNGSQARQDTHGEHEKPAAQRILRQPGSDNPYGGQDAENQHKTNDAESYGLF